MNILTTKLKGTNSRLALLVIFFVILNTVQLIRAENLNSTNYEIKDAGISNGSSTLDSASYSLIGTIGDFANDTRLTSGTYGILSGFGKDFLSTPKVQCFETNSNSDNSECLSLPNQMGMLGECGGGGCYSKAKIEIESQDNPYDTLYTVKLLNTTDNITYYLKSDHTLSLAYSIANYLTKCAIEGKDSKNPNCDQEGDSGWNSNLQSSNIYYLESNKTYIASIRALNGDYTETSYGDSKTAMTASQIISLDIDVGPNSDPTVESTLPYTINALSGVGYQTVQTASNLIWFDFNSNNPKGFSFYLKSKNKGLFSASTQTLIPSEDEDLTTDNNENGGYGIKIYNSNTTQQSLGPLIKSNNFNTNGENIVGSVTDINKLLFSTRETETEKGEIFNGRGGIILKAKTRVTTPPAGDYIDELVFTIIGDF
jgi:hypothetical protein